MPEKDEGFMPLTAHLTEFRKRLIISCIAVLISTLISYIFSEEIFKFLSRPLVLALPVNAKSLVFLGVVEPFFTYLKASILSGIILSSPVIIYQLWLFIAPALYQNERRWFWPVVAISIIFFFAGVIFAYKVVFPFAFKYLLSFANEELRPAISISMYFSIATKFLLAFGIIFELPLFMLILARFNIVDVPFFVHYRRYAILLSFVFGALLTPPDMISQLMMAAPIIVLYELGILGARLFGRRKADE